MRTKKLVFAFMLIGGWSSSYVSAGVWYASTRKGASDTNPGTYDRPVRSVRKALSLASPGDTVMFSMGLYLCSDEKSPDGRPGLGVTLCSAGDEKGGFLGWGFQ